MIGRPLFLRRNRWRELVGRLLALLLALALLAAGWSVLVVAGTVAGHVFASRGGLACPPAPGSSPLAKPMTRAPMARLVAA